MTANINFANVDILLGILELPCVPSDHGAIVHTQVFRARQHLVAILARHDSHHLSQILVTRDTADQVHSRNWDPLLLHVVQAELKLSLYLRKCTELGRGCMVAQVSNRLEVLRSPFEARLDHIFTVDEALDECLQASETQVGVVYLLKWDRHSYLGRVTECG